MSDYDIERVLRTTLTGRAGTVSAGAQWDGAEEDGRGAVSAHRHRARWIAPLAATVLVLAVAVPAGIAARRHDPGRAATKPVVVTGQLPVPAGMKAVDALGVEIFVPNDFGLDAFCSPRAVLRPVAVTSVPACPFVPYATTVFVQPREADAMGPTTTTCRERISLFGEISCLTSSAGGFEGSKRGVTLGMWWPRHKIGIQVTTFDRALGIRIIRTAHAVPVDRNGCAAERNPIQAPGKHDPADVGGAPPVPDARPVTSMGVCWYIAHRLVASAILGSKDAGTVLRIAASAEALFSPAGASCADVDRADGVVLAVRYANGSAGEGVLHLAKCAARPAQPALVSYVATLARLADMPLALNYPTPQ